MRVLFIYPETGFLRPHIITMEKGRYYHGLAQLSAYIRKEGHETGLLHLIWPRSDDYIRDFIRGFKPDLLGLSALTHNFPEIPRLARIGGLELGLPVIFGGIHPTIDPYNSCAVPGIKWICVGEGEKPLSALLKAMENGDSTDNIPGLFLKKGSKIIENPPPEPMDPNLLPLPHWELFDILNVDETRLFSRLAVLGARGCPHNCRYCCNYTVKKRLSHKNYYRPRRPQLVVDEIATFLERYPGIIKEIQFQQDIFAPDIKWIEEFAPLYKKKVNLPFQALFRPESLDEKMVKILADCGCFSVFFGVEAGDGDIRHQVLGRSGLVNKAFEATKLLRKYGIKIGTFNMAGAPSEGAKELFATITANGKIAPDFIQLSRFTPYPGSPFYKQSIREKSLKKAVYPTYFDGSPLIRAKGAKGGKGGKKARREKSVKKMVPAFLPGVFLLSLFNEKNRLYRDLATFLIYLIFLIKPGLLNRLYEKILLEKSPDNPERNLLLSMVFGDKKWIVPPFMVNF